MASLTEYLTAMADTMMDVRQRDDFKYCSYEELVLVEGQYFAAPERLRPPGFRKMRDKRCYSNSVNALVSFGFKEQGYRYCEGFASGGIIPVMHAWLVSPDGQVVDPTWRSATEYHGVVIETTWLFEQLLKNGYHGIMSEDWRNDFALLRHGFPAEARFVAESNAGGR